MLLSLQSPGHGLPLELCTTLIKEQDELWNFPLESREAGETIDRAAFRALEEELHLDDVTTATLKDASLFSVVTLNGSTRVFVSHLDGINKTPGYPTDMAQRFHRIRKEISDARHKGVKHWQGRHIGCFLETRDVRHVPVRVLLAWASGSASSIVDVSGEQLPSNNPEVLRSPLRHLLRSDDGKPGPAHDMLLGELAKMAVSVPAPPTAVPSALVRQRLYLTPAVAVCQPDVDWGGIHITIVGKGNEPSLVDKARSVVSRIYDDNMRERRSWRLGPHGHESVKVLDAGSQWRVNFDSNLLDTLSVELGAAHLVNVMPIKSWHFMVTSAPSSPPRSKFCRPLSTTNRYGASRSARPRPSAAVGLNSLGSHSEPTSKRRVGILAL